MTMLRVRGLGKIFDVIDDCPKDMAASIFGTVDPDGVIGLDHDLSVVLTLRCIDPIDREGPSEDLDRLSYHV